MNFSSLRTMGFAATASVAVAASGMAYRFGGHNSPAGFTTGVITRGTIARSVNATGTVNPVTTVQVGSYVSGPIQAIYTDFNARVKAGQLCAKIDPRPYEVEVAKARAALMNSKAQLQKDQADLAYKDVAYRRGSKLIKANTISQDAFDGLRSAADQARAQVELARAKIKENEAALRQAELNLEYTSIVSPVDGTVVSRNVDVGQTVTARYQTPTLFLIAKDLTQMQVDTNVSESDIGAVRVGQRAEFRVDAFPGRKFEGLVAQVRQAPITVQNVITYDVVVSVANPELLLKPGMTANVAIVTEQRDNVVRCPLAALRFSPDGLKARQATASQSRPAGPRRGTVWVLDGGAPRAVPVSLGLDDGNLVEVLDGALQAHETVITGGPASAREAAAPLLTLKR